MHRAAHKRGNSSGKSAVTKCVGLAFVCVFIVVIWFQFTRVRTNSTTTSTGASENFMQTSRRLHKSTDATTPVVPSPKVLAPLPKGLRLQHQQALPILLAAPSKVNRGLALHLSKIKFAATELPAEDVSDAQISLTDTALPLHSNLDIPAQLPLQHQVSAPVVLKQEKAEVPLPPRSPALPVNSLDFPAAPTCEAEDSKKGASDFIAIKSYWELSCAHMRVVTAIHDVDPSRKGKTFMEVGANKGYIIAHWIALWAPDYAGVRADLGAFWEPLGVYTPCGSCSECQSAVDELASVIYSSAKNGIWGESTDLRFYAFEAAPATFNALTESPLVSALPAGFVTITHALVSNTVLESTNFPNCKLAYEGCSEGSTEFELSSVPVTTIDEFVSKENLQSVYWLNIGAEGGDPTVLLGTDSTLKAGRVSMLSFNYHGLLGWLSDGSRLADMIPWLDTRGFSCFLSTRDKGLWLLTGCWDAAFETYELSSVFCAHRSRPELAAALYAMSNHPDMSPLSSP